MMLHPDACPLCQHIHGLIDPEWECPEHRHRLYFYMAGDGWLELHRCPVQGCQHVKLVDIPHRAGIGAGS